MRLTFAATYREDGLVTAHDCDFTKDPALVEAYAGLVPEVLPSANISKLAYLSIDMNCTQPEVDALEYFWPRLVSGGVKVLTLPTGQGLILKP